jgi:hypothetical protein
MSTASTKQNKCPETEKTGVCGVDNPIQAKPSVIEIDMILHNLSVVLRAHKLKGESLELLVTITKKWNCEGVGSTVYALANNDYRQCTPTGIKVKRLYRKGLLEVVGIGNKQARVYAPSAAGLSALRPLCNVA